MAELSAIDILNAAVDAGNLVAQNTPQQPAVNGYNLHAVRDAEVDTSALTPLEQDALNLDFNQLALKYGVDTARAVTGNMQSSFLDYYGDANAGSPDGTLTDKFVGIGKATEGMVAGLVNLGLSTVAPETGAAFAQWHNKNITKGFDNLMSEDRQRRSRALSAIRAEQDRLNDYLHDKDIAQGKSSTEAFFNAVGRDVLHGISNIANNGLAASEALESAVGSLAPSGIVAKGISKLAGAATNQINKQILKAGATQGTKAASLGALNAASKVSALGQDASWAISQGLMEGGAGYSDTLNRVLEMDTKDLYAKSPEFGARVQKLMAEGMSKPQAEEQAKLDLAIKTARVEGAAQGLLGMAAGSLTERTAGMLKAPFANRGFVNSAIKQPATEALEEALQEGGGQFTQNLAVREFADKDARLYEGVGQNAVMGAFGGMGSSHILGAPSILRSAVSSGSKLAAKGAWEAGKYVAKTGAELAAKGADKLVKNTILDKKFQDSVSKAVSGVATTLNKAYSSVFKDSEPEGKVEDNKPDPIKDEYKQVLSTITSLNEAEKEQFGTDNRTVALEQEFNKLVKAFEDNNEDAQVEAAVNVLTLAQPLTNLSRDKDGNLFQSYIQKNTEHLSEEERQSILDTVDNLSSLDQDPNIKRVFDAAQDVLTKRVQKAQNMTAEELSKDSVTAKAAAQAMMLPGNEDVKFTEEQLEAIEKAVGTLTDTQKKLFRCIKTGIGAKRYIDNLLKEEKIPASVVNKAASNISAGSSVGKKFTLEDHMARIKEKVLANDFNGAREAISGLYNWYVAQQNRLAAFNESLKTPKGKDNNVEYNTYNPEDGSWFTNKAYLKEGNNNSELVAKAAYLEAVKTFNMLQAAKELAPDSVPELNAPVQIELKSFKDVNAKAKRWNKATETKIGKLHETKPVEVTKEPVVEKKEVPVETTESKVKASEPEVKITGPLVEAKEEVKTPEPTVKTEEPEVKTSEAEVKTETVEQKPTEPEAKVEEQPKELTTTEKNIIALHNNAKEGKLGFFSKGINFAKAVVNHFIYKVADKDTDTSKSEARNRSLVWGFTTLNSFGSFLKNYTSALAGIKKILAANNNKNAVPTNNKAELDKYLAQYRKIRTSFTKPLEEAFNAAMEKLKQNSVIWNKETNSFNEDKLEQVLYSPITKIALFVVKQGDTYVLDPVIKEAAAMAAFDWFLGAQLNSSTMNTEDITDSNAFTDAQIRFIKSGVIGDNLVQDLRSKLHEIFDSNPTYKQKIGGMSSAIDQIAAEIARAILPKDTKQASAFGVKKHIITGEVDGTKTITVYTFPRYNIRNPKHKDNCLYMKGLFPALLVQSREAEAYYDPDAKVHIPQYQSHSRVPLTNKQKRFLKRCSDIKFYRDQAMEDTFLDLSDEQVLELFGYSGLPSSGSKEEANYHADDLEAKRGKNLSILGALAVIRKEKAIFDEMMPEVARDQRYMRYGGNISKVGRYQMTGDSNPQGNKVMRVVSTATKSEHVDLSETNSDASRLHDRCLAQGMGFKVHQMSDEAIHEALYGDNGVLVNEAFTKQVAPYFEAIAEGKEITPELRKGLIEGFKALQKATGIDGNEWSFMCLKEAALVAKARREGTANDMTTYSFLEADGVTDGAMNYAMMNSTGVFDKKWLSLVGKGGFSFVGKGVPLIALKNIKGDTLGAKKDLYTAVKDNLTSSVSSWIQETMDDALGGIIWDKNKKEWIIDPKLTRVQRTHANQAEQTKIANFFNSLIAAWSILGNIESSNEDLVSFANNSNNGVLPFNPARNTVKNPVTQLIYHASNTSVAKSILHGSSSSVGWMATLNSCITNFLQCQADPKRKDLPMGVKFFWNEYDGTNAELLRQKFIALDKAFYYLSTQSLGTRTVDGDSIPYIKQGKNAPFHLSKLLANTGANTLSLDPVSYKTILDTITTFAGQIQKAYEANFGDNYYKDQDVILRASKAISAIAQGAQQVAIATELKPKVKSPYGWSGEDVEETRDHYKGTSSDTEVNGHIITVSKEDKATSPVKKIAESTKGGIAITDTPKVAVDPGVSVFANSNIAMGDASMVMSSVKNITEAFNEAMRGLLVFDGIHMGHSDIDSYASLINKATGVVTQNNLFGVLAKKLHSSFQAFTDSLIQMAKDLEEAGQNPDQARTSVYGPIFDALYYDTDVHFGKRAVSEIIKSLMENGALTADDYESKNPEVQARIKGLIAQTYVEQYLNFTLAQITDLAKDAKARQIAIAGVGLSSDHMASSENPSYTEGIFNKVFNKFGTMPEGYVLTEDEILIRLNAVRQAYLAAIKAKPELFDVDGNYTGEGFIKFLSPAVEAYYSYARATSITDRFVPAHEYFDIESSRKAPLNNTVEETTETAEPKEHHTVTRIKSSFVLDPEKVDVHPEECYVETDIDNLNMFYESAPEASSLFDNIWQIARKMFGIGQNKPNVRLYYDSAAWKEVQNKFGFGESCNGVFSPATNTLYVAVYDTTDAKIKMVINHELIHSITAAKINQIENGQSVTAEERQAYNNLKSILKAIREGKFDNQTLTKEEQTVFNHLKKLCTENTDQFSINEIMAYITTTPELVSLFKRIAVNPKEYPAQYKGLQKVYDFAKNFLTNLFTLVLGKKPTKLQNVYAVVADATITLGIAQIKENTQDPTAQEQASLEPESNTNEMIRDQLMKASKISSIAELKEKLFNSKDVPEKLLERFDNDADVGLDNLVEVFEASNTLSALLPHWTAEDQNTASSFLVLLANKEGLNSETIKGLQDAYTAFSNAFNAEVRATKDIDPRYQELIRVLTGNGDTQIPAKQVLAAFSAVALVDKGFRDVINGIKTDKTKAPKNEPYLDKLANRLGKYGLDGLTNLYHGTKEGIEVNKAVKHCTKNLLVHNSIPKVLRKSFAVRVDDAITKYVGKALDKAGNKILKSTDNFSSTSKQTLAMVAAIRKAMVADDTFFDFVANELYKMDAVPVSIKELISDVVGITDANWNIYRDIKIIKQSTQAKRQEFNEVFPRELEKLFKNKLSKTQHKMLYSVLTKIDTSVFAHITAIKYFMSSKANRADRMAEIEAKIKAHYGSNAQAIISGSKELAKFLVTGKCSTTNLCVNAASIANLNMLRSKDNTAKTQAAKVDKKLIKEIDQYISLASIELMSQKDIDQFLTLLDQEPQGMGCLVGALKQLQEVEQKKAKGNARYNARKGYIAPLKASDGTIKIASKNQEKELLARGFKRVKKYQGTSFDNSNLYVYYCPFMDPKYNEGMLQLARPTAGGADIGSGFSGGLHAGYIKNPKQVRTLHDYLPDKIGNKALDAETFIPVMDAEGNTIAYQRTIDPKIAQQYLRLEENIFKVLGRNKGRQYEESVVNEVNNKLVDKLIKDYAEATDQDNYVDIFDLAKKDRTVKDALSRLPLDVIKAFENSKHTDGKFMVRRELVNDVIGYRSASVADLWTGNTRYSKRNQKLMQHCITSVLGPNAYRYLRNIENWNLAVMSYARNMVVVKSVVVPAINILSNVYQLQANGVPLLTIATEVPRKVKELENYLKLNSEIMRLRVLSADANKPEQRRLQLLIDAKQTAIDKMSISPLLKEGEFNVISNDRSKPDEMRFTDGNLGDWIDQMANSLPNPIRDLVRYGLITKDTPIYKVLEKSVQYGDFVAKSILYDFLIKERSKTPEYAVRFVREEFVDYDKSMGRTRQYLESMGLLWFWNYKVRSIKVAARNIRHNPFSALMNSIALETMPIMDGVGTAVQDNWIAKLLEGGLGYSIGIGPASAIIDKNWVAAFIR